MPIPSSGALSLSTIQGEFGGSNPISLSEYYAGGSLVPSGTSGTNGLVPSSGSLSVSRFYGTSAIPPLGASISGSADAFIFAASPPSRTLTTNTVTCAASGGSGSYSYAWSRVSGDTFTVDTASSASTTFTITQGINTVREAVYRCTVTDTVNLTTTTANVNVRSEYAS